jgi:hypothetical protein
MDSRRTPREVIAANVRDALNNSGECITTLAEATDIDATTLESHLRSETPFTAWELARVGGFFRFGVSPLLEGAVA